jgi:hypothetical protein
MQVSFFAIESAQWFAAMRRADHIQIVDGDTGSGMAREIMRQSAATPLAVPRVVAAMATLH